MRSDVAVFDLSFFKSDLIKNAKKLNEKGEEEPFINPATLRRLYKEDENGEQL